MAYSSIADVRLLGGFSAQELDDGTLADLIARADRELLSAVAVWCRDEDLRPTPKGQWIDGTNRVFYLAHRPVADTNFDATVDANDLKVYAWTDGEDETTKSQVAVSQVNPATGRLVLAVAPQGGVRRLTADYAYYLAHPDWELFRLASALLASYLAVLHLHARLPRTIKLPELYVSSEGIGAPFLTRYNQTLDRLRPLAGVAG